MLAELERERLAELEKERLAQERQLDTFAVEDLGIRGLHAKLNKMNRDIPAINQSDDSEVSRRTTEKAM
jgi:hypothetical protein